MARIVYYHHPLVENFSLKFSSATSAAVHQRRTQSDGDTKLMGYPFETPVFVLYERDIEIESLNEVEYDRDWLTERISELDRPGQVVAFRLVELLEAAVTVRQEDEFRLYKEFEPQKIQYALDHISWGASLPTVAGELMSNLILRHSLPNANHRTGIAMLQFCMESAVSGFEMPHTHIDDYTWRDWVDPYIVTSKQLITVRRNNVRFQHLEELGVNIVERKDGIQISLSDFDLDMHWRTAQSQYAEIHEKHCTAFAKAVLARTEQENLGRRSGPTKTEFIDYLETGLVERDFNDLF